MQKSYPMARRSGAKAASHRAGKHAEVLIELLLKEMRQSVRDPKLSSEERWAKLFGDKQCAVVNLHKLVHALAMLPKVAGQAAQEAPEDKPLSSEEITLLTEWLQEK